MNNDSEISLVILVFDSLRYDFFDVAAREGVGLPHFEELFALAPYSVPLWCGSHPTLPMRTDLLTGRLCFLDGRWESPRADEDVWIAETQLRSAPCHLGDNYMLWCERLGGYFQKYFDPSIALRGTGADPWWAEMSSMPSLPPKELLRDPRLERQYRANVLLGSAPTGRRAANRLFAMATKLFLSQRPATLWIECFQTHEPWTNLELDDPSIPGYANYGRIPEEISKEEVQRQRELYVRRLREVDDALADFIKALKRVPVDLVILSDHGVYLGEFGLFGKPKAQPLLPPVARLVCRTSLRPTAIRSSTVQPHELQEVLALRRKETSAGLSKTDIPVTLGEEFKVFGRNSPSVRHLQVLTREGIAVFERKAVSRSFLSFDRLLATRPWQDARINEHPDLDRAANYLERTFGSRSWVRNFGFGARSDNYRGKERL